MKNQVKSWSFSRWNDFRSCRAKFNFKYNLKVKEQPSKAMEKGTIAHDHLEHYLKGNIRQLSPKIVPTLRADYAALRKLKPVVEQQWVFTREWQECEWNDWNRAWCRVKVDAAVPATAGVMRIIDHKTGKPYGSNDEQMSLYAATTVLAYEGVSAINVELWYIDHDTKQEARYDAQEATKLIKVWEKKVSPIFTETKWKESPGEACRFCSFKKAMGGPCKY